jgi:DNA-binding LacI/PurR family transcriptional regulator
MIDQQGCPVVSPPLDDSATMADGNVFIGRVQAEHLIERGHDRLVYAYLADRRDDPFGRVRAQAAGEVCAARGLAAPARIDVPLDPQGARAALAGLLARGGGPVGIACSNDEVALALTFAAIGLGVAVPEEVAAVGVGGGQVGQLVTPRLTSVAFDLRASLAPIRAAIAHACTATGEPLALPSGDAFSVLQGQTT